MSFMLEIDSCRPPVLDQLALEFLTRTRGKPSLGQALASVSASRPFCRRIAEVPDTDQAIARRLGVPVAVVRAWRSAGRGRR